MHPSEEIKAVKSKHLYNKKIVLGVTGSIAAVECVKLARELIRHGADVIPVMTKAAEKIIHPDSLWFATGNKPVTELTGAVEHVSLCGKTRKPADLLLICPCTANTLSKIAHGVDDTPVTTFATTALGSKIPVLIVPAMHASMYENKIIQRNIKKCKQTGIQFVDPEIDKNKAKMPSLEKIVSHVFRETLKRDYAGKKILVIGGPSAELIDDVRIITNISSGKTAVFLAKNAFYRGAHVELWYGRGTEKTPGFIKQEFFTSINDVLKLLNNKNMDDFDIIIVCAAFSDYQPMQQKGKISSDKPELVIHMKPAPKIISRIREKAPHAKIIGFKVEETSKHLKERSLTLLKKNNLDYVVGNTISGFSGDVNEIWIFNQEAKVFHKKGDKNALANYILDIVK